VDSQGTGSAISHGHHETLARLQGPSVWMAVETRSSSADSLEGLDVSRSLLLVAADPIEVQPGAPYSSSLRAKHRSGGTDYGSRETNQRCDDALHPYCNSEFWHLGRLTSYLACQVPRRRVSKYYRRTRAPGSKADIPFMPHVWPWTRLPRPSNGPRRHGRRRNGYRCRAIDPRRGTR
jgi:hypothetical protein